MHNRYCASELVREWMRKPLLHFLILGVGIFLLFRFVADPADTNDDRIVVTADQVDHFVAVFSRTRQRPPTGEELDGLIDNFVLEEMLYRHALALRLDQNDTIIRRRLKQKIEFLVDDLATREPSDTDLQRFLDENQDSFREEARVDFEHIHFKETARPQADQVLARLQGGMKLDIDSVGDRLPLPSRFESAGEAQISGLFGEEFKEDLLAQEAGRWTGPIRSPYGWHLVKIDRHIGGRIPGLSEIREVVKRDWLYDRRRVAQQTLFDQLRSRYTVIVEPPEGTVQ